jgi:signal transduction histidine kinase
MVPAALQEICQCLPQAVLRVYRDTRVLWADPALSSKTDLTIGCGQSLLELFDPGPERERVENAIRTGSAFEGSAVTCALNQVWVQVRPCGEGTASWVLLRPSSTDDEVTFARALQEIARAVGESLEVESVCAAAVLAIVRFAQVRRAAVYLRAETGLRRGALSDLAGGALGGELDGAMEASLSLAIDSGRPQLGITRQGSGRDAIYAAVPLHSQGRVEGALFLCKPEATHFSVREMDLWSAAATQLGVAVENARLLRETQSALRMRDEFMSIASHELKTPLTPLKMSLYLMGRRLEEQKPIELAAVDKAKRQVERLSTLITQLLESSRAELGKLSIDKAPLDFGQLVLEAVEEFRAAYPRELLLELPAERVWVMGDRGRLDQVVVNLLENAIKYSPDGAPVRVAVERLRGAARLTVADRGIGIPTPDQGRIFQRFFRAQNASCRNFGGLGLGLFISHSVVSLHGGAMEVTSAEGQGARFTVNLPRMQARALHKLPRFVLYLGNEEGPGARAVQVLRKKGFELVRDEGPEALRNLVHQPLEAVVVGPQVPGAAARLLWEAVRAASTVRPLPVLWLGGRPAWAEAKGTAPPALSRALGRALEPPLRPIEP